MTALPDTLIVDGVDVQSLTGITVTRLDLFAPGTRRGSDDVIPGRQGVVRAPKIYDAYAFSVEILVEGATRAEMVANLAAAGAAIGGGSDGDVTLTRRLSTTGGYVDHNANGEFVGWTAIDLLNPQTGATELQFLNTSGAWTPDSGVTWLVP